MSMTSVNLTKDNDMITLDWENVDDINNYRINRTIFGNDTDSIGQGEINSFEDTDFGKYIKYSDISYSVAPYISSLNIKVLGSPTVITIPQN